MSRVSALAAIVTIGFGVAVFSAPSSAMDGPKTGNLITAQATEPGTPGTKGKSNGTKGNGPKGNQSPPQSTPAPKPPSSNMQNAPQSGVPARCAQITDAAERQKCMNTPKGQ